MDNKMTELEARVRKLEEQLHRLITGEDLPLLYGFGSPGPSAIPPRLYNEACARVDELQRVIDAAAPHIRSTGHPAIAQLMMYAGKVERYVYEVAKCGCLGFFHSNACSDQNPVDPFGSILNPEHRRMVRAMATAHFVRPHPETKETGV